MLRAQCCDYHSANSTTQAYSNIEYRYKERLS
ncbi:hypothetical protein Clow_00932 [Corynebacterium lowii]|uniref:Uncharacterized protein n=1 Tax=Corynebacterium lowii TaxID=1544413 RepID=A0A0Q0UKC5_9CORY|nr:hypothetical protein Clow_00932 [Corynebacterium lowii]MDP9851410.1 hypothetical protein [Corynebacterium lowii]